MFEAASVDGESITYPDVVQGAAGSPHRRVFDSLVLLVQACMSADSRQRPGLRNVQNALDGLLAQLTESVQEVACHCMLRITCCVLLRCDAGW